MNYIAVFKHVAANSAVTDCGRRACVHVTPVFNGYTDGADSMRYDVYARCSPPYISLEEQRFVFCGFINVRWDAPIKQMHRGLKCALVAFSSLHCQLSVDRVVFTQMSDSDILVGMDQLRTQIRECLQGGAAGALLSRPGPPAESGISYSSVAVAARVPLPNVLMGLAGGTHDFVCPPLLPVVVACPPPFASGQAVKRRPPLSAVGKTIKKVAKQPLISVCISAGDTARYPAPLTHFSTEKIYCFGAIASRKLINSAAAGLLCLRPDRIPAASSSKSPYLGSIFFEEDINPVRAAPEGQPADQACSEDSFRHALDTQPDLMLLCHLDCAEDMDAAAGVDLWDYGLSDLPFQPSSQ